MPPEVREAVDEARRSRAGVYLTFTVQQEAEVRATFEQSDQVDAFVLAAEESERYLETGELPERVERWLDSYDSRRAT
jgi:hypothetical protein